jgi:phosphoenolpyruvate carboxylase
MPPSWPANFAAEQALADMQAVSIAASLVRPVRWEVEIFGFRTVSLDLPARTPR